MNNELKHYGILGQKWGVRRYQDADGNLTSAGKARYTKLNDNSYIRNDSRDMSDDQLNSSIKRLRSETEYNRLSDQISPGAKKIGETFLSAGIGFLGGVASTYAQKWVTSGEIPKGKDFARKAIAMGAVASILTTATKLGVNLGQTPKEPKNQG